MSPKLHAWVVLIGGGVLGACSRETSDADADGSGRPREATAPAPYRLRDATVGSGLDAFVQENGNREKPFIVESIGAGVGLLDHDCDGDLDVYLTNGSSFEGWPAGKEPRDALFANDGDGRFDDVTGKTGLGDTAWTMGVRVVDLDGNAWPDVYLTNYGPNVLYLNRGDGTFEDVTARAGVGDPRWSTGACFLDHDADGDLDLYVANYVEFDLDAMLADRPAEVYQGITVYKGPRGLPAAHDRFYVNAGTGIFEDATTRAGIDAVVPAFGFQCVTFDVDQDGWLDLFVANDSVANFLWHNDGEGAFENRALRHGLALNVFGKAQAGMGVAVGDYDGDLRADLYLTTFSHDYSTMFRGLDDGFFADVTHRLRLVADTDPEVAWSCHFLDLDCDGDQELFAVNGHVYPQVDDFDVGLTYAQRNGLFEFADERFRVPAGGGGPGLDAARVGRGAAVGDLDGDGDLDILVGNLDDHPTLLLNECPSGNWIQVELIGSGGNRDAIGARVVARVGDRAQLRLVGTADGFLSSSDPRLHFGLGAARVLDVLEVTWPDGVSETFRDLPAGHRIVIAAGSPHDSRPCTERVQVVAARERALGR